MNTSKCPITVKVTNKLVSQLQDILVLLDAKDKDARLDFLRFRGKVVKQYGQELFHDVLNKAQGGLNVEGLYHGGSTTSRINSTSENRSTMPQTASQRD